jgi:hypothetical protein
MVYVKLHFIGQPQRRAELTFRICVLVDFGLPDLPDLLQENLQSAVVEMYTPNGLPNSSR